jgi:hypothetical protein
LTRCSQQQPPMILAGRVQAAKQDERPASAGLFLPTIALRSLA